MPDYKITIAVKNVALGDIKSLVEDIEERHAESFDADQGDFSIQVSTLDGFPVDLEDE